MTARETYDIIHDDHGCVSLNRYEIMNRHIFSSGFYFRLCLLQHRFQPDNNDNLDKC